MKLGAYPFPVSGNVAANLEQIRHGIRQAAAQGVELLLFPECALTGYPPRHLPSPAVIDFDALDRIHDELQALAAKCCLHLVIGTMQREGDAVFNTALHLAPDGSWNAYRKRALWGWDAEHFTPGTETGVWQIGDLRVGVRICYEVRFPEYFRELYRECTDLNLLLFCDVADSDNPARYDLIRGHMMTRAVENVCPILAVNATAPCQTAPTGFYGASGQTIAELPRGKEGLLVAEWSPQPLTFGEQGRRVFSDRLTED